MSETIHTLAEGLDLWFLKHAENAAIQYNGKGHYNGLYDGKVLYKDLDKISKNIAQFLRIFSEGEPLIGVFASKDPFTLTCIAGIIRAGKAFVPLNPAFPIEKNNEIIKQSGINTLFGDIFGDFADELHEILSQTHLFPTRPSSKYYRGKEEYTTAAISPNDAAYVFFTSGSTGKPKGVQISHANVLSYLNNIEKIVNVEPGTDAARLLD